MSQVVRFTGASPYGVQSDMAQITISGGQDTLSLAAIEETKKHTLHFWVKGGKDTTLHILKNNTIVITFNITTTWSENSVTFDASANDVISMQFGSSGSYWVWHPKLEVGTKATDFSESQVDLKTAIVQTANSISLLAEKTIGDGESSLKSILNVQANQISAKVGSSGGDAKSFAWQLTTDGFYLYSNNKLVLQCDSTGLSVDGQGTFTGTINASGGVIDGDMNVKNRLIFTDPNDITDEVNYVQRDNTAGRIGVAMKTENGNMIKASDQCVEIDSPTFFEINSSLKITDFGTQDPSTYFSGRQVSNKMIYFQLVD